MNLQLSIRSALAYFSKSHRKLLHDTIFRWLSKGKGISIESGELIEKGDWHHLIVDGCISPQLNRPRYKYTPFPHVIGMVIENIEMDEDYGDNKLFGDYEYRALCPTVVWQIPRAHHILMSQERDFMLYLYYRKCLDSNLTKNLLTTHITTRARDRIANYLLFLGFHIGKRVDGIVEIPVVQNDLASLCGLTRTSLGKTLRQLQDEKIVETGYEKIRLIDQVRLGELSGVPTFKDNFELSTMEDYFNDPER